MKYYLPILLACTIVLSVPNQLSAQRCKAHTHWETKSQLDHKANKRMEELEMFTRNYSKSFGTASRDASVTIPVVFHVLYNNQAQNLSDAQIQSQLDILNEDFRLMNSDSLDSSHPFWPYTIDTEIEFCLATQDPDGFETTGINRVQVGIEYFSGTD